ncbi:hypothetical protein ACEQ8H_005291 [Pleosporales sp. CAS-2024a]
MSLGEDLGPTRDNGHQTLRSRKDGSAKELPLPPLLDSIALEDRMQWENPKARPRAADLTPFQRKLQANAYAHALASPVRQCRATQIYLPMALLISLHARPHPTTQDPWLVPVSFTTDEKHLGPPYRFICSQLVAAQLGTKKQWQRGIYSRMEEKLGSDLLKRMVWREDTPELILELMQKELVKKLSWNLSFRGRLTPVASPMAEDIKNVANVSCVLVFGSLRTRADILHDRAKEIAFEMHKWASYMAKSFPDKLDPHASPDVTHHAPSWYHGPMVPRLQPRSEFPELEFRTTVWRGARVAVYSLTDLLGEDKARQLLDASQYTKENCVVVKRARHNVPIELLLMRLQAYIARSRP